MVSTALLWAPRSLALDGPTSLLRFAEDIVNPVRDGRSKLQDHKSNRRVELEYGYEVAGTDVASTCVEANPYRCDDNLSGNGVTPYSDIDGNSTPNGVKLTNQTRKNPDCCDQGYVSSGYLVFAITTH